METCNHLYPPQITEKIHDSISYQKEYVKIKGDSTYIILPFNCIEDSLRHVVEIYKGKLGKYETTITWINGKLNFTQKTLNDSIAYWSKYQQKVDVQIKEVPVQVDKKVVPRWCWLLLIAVISYIGLRFSPLKKFIP
jgi:hypothetical protein